MSKAMDIEKLLQPIPGDHQCGEDIAFSPEVDAIARAREADDPTLAQGDWETSLREADWPFVARECAQLIAVRSKDLRLAVWLAEAVARTDGMRALGDALLLAAGLCTRYWDGVHPLPDEGGYEQRAGNIGWLAARLPQLIGESPRGEGQGWLDDLRHAQHAVLELEKAIDERLGADGPGLTASKALLRDLVADAARGLDNGAGGTGSPDSPVTGAVNGTGPRPELPGGAGPLQSRAQALAQLRAVADFFRRTEPHSPVAYLADKAAEWGAQPLHVWLRGVIKDDASYAHLEEMLGIRAPGH